MATGVASLHSATNHQLTEGQGGPVADPSKREGARVGTMKINGVEFGCQLNEELARRQAPPKSYNNYG